MRTGLFLLIFFGLYGCQRPDFAREIQTLDSLAREVQLAGKTVDQLDTAKLARIARETEAELELLAIALGTDTLAQPYAIAVIGYKNLGPFARQLHQERARLHTETERCLTQIRNLKETLEKNTLEETLSRQYTAAEKQATETLLHAYESHRQECLTLFSQFDSLHPVIKELVEEKENSPL